MATLIQSDLTAGMIPNQPEEITLKEWEDVLLKVIDELDKSDEVREDLLREYKRNEQFWKGIQFIFWSGVARDYRSLYSYLRDSTDLDFNPELVNKIVNIYRAYGESIIAALTTGIPKVRFIPDDADNPDDILASKARGKLAELIQTHNHIQMMLIKALYILYNQSFAAFYNYYHTDKAYGMSQIPVYDKEEIPVDQTVCQNCGEVLSETENVSEPERVEDTNPEKTLEEKNLDELGLSTPDLNEEVIPPQPTAEPITCPNCGSIGSTYTQPAMSSRTFVKGYEDSPKGRECIEVYGPLNVHIPSYVSDLKDTPFLTLETEHHFSILRKLYPERYNDIKTGGGGDDNSTRWARRTIDSQDHQSIRTLQRRWIRPWAFNVLEKEDKLRKRIQTEFPNGIFATFVERKLMEIPKDELLDDHWTVTKSPTCLTLNEDPIGTPLIPIQEMTNELVQFEMDTIQNAVPEGFADPDVVNFKARRNQKSLPGMISPAKPKPGTQSLAQSFFEFHHATLSQEVSLFRNKLDQDGQFVVGALPPIYGGGAGPDSSKTLGEYEIRRSQALQRLSTKWKILNHTFAELMYKVTSEFAENMTEDIRFSKPSGPDFVNVWIKQAELSGTVGSCEPETSEQFPQSWNEIKAAIFELFSLGDPEINATLKSPENVELMAKIIGIPELTMPGQADRDNQLREIAEMVKGIPTPIDMQLDNHQIHLVVTRNWLISEVGREARMSNPEAYMLVMQHFMEHLTQVQIAQQKQMEAEMRMNAEGGNKNKPPSSSPKPVSAPGA